MKQFPLLFMAAASNFVISAFFAFNLFLITAHGRNLLVQKNNETLTLKAVSRATASLVTNINDATGLLSIILLYPNLEEANGDPCVPPVWSWIICDSNYRVTAMYLSGKLKDQNFGIFPDFSTMTALQTIDLSENGLVGTIPFFLGTFPYLQNLNMDDNLLGGVVPDSLACNKNLKLSVDGNPNLLQSSTCPSKTTSNTRSSSSSNNDEFYTTSSSNKKKNKLPIILGITIPIFAIFWIAVGLFAVFRHKAKAQAAIAEASKPGNEIPMDERPITSQAEHNMSP